MKRLQEGLLSLIRLWNDMNLESTFRVLGASGWEETEVLLCRGLSAAWSFVQRGL